MFKLVIYLFGAYLIWWLFNYNPLLSCVCMILYLFFRFRGDKKKGLMKSIKIGPGKSNDYQNLKIMKDLIELDLEMEKNQRKNRITRDYISQEHRKIIEIFKPKANCDKFPENYTLDSNSSMYDHIDLLYNRKAFKEITAYFLDLIIHISRIKVIRLGREKRIQKAKEKNGADGELFAYEIFQILAEEIYDKTSIKYILEKSKRLKSIEHGYYSSKNDSMEIKMDNSKFLISLYYEIKDFNEDILAFRISSDLNLSLLPSLAHYSSSTKFLGKSFFKTGKDNGLNTQVQDSIKKFLEYRLKKMEIDEKNSDGDLTISEKILKLNAINNLKKKLSIDFDNPSGFEHEFDLGVLRTSSRILGLFFTGFSVLLMIQYLLHSIFSDIINFALISFIMSAFFLLFSVYEGQAKTINGGL